MPPSAPLPEEEHDEDEEDLDLDIPATPDSEKAADLSFDEVDLMEARPYSPTSPQSPVGNGAEESQAELEQQLAEGPGNDPADRVEPDNASSSALDIEAPSQEARSERGPVSAEMMTRVADAILADLVDQERSRADSLAHRSSEQPPNEPSPDEPAPKASSTHEGLVANTPQPDELEACPPESTLEQQQEEQDKQGENEDTHRTASENEPQELLGPLPTLPVVHPACEPMPDESLQQRVLETGASVNNLFVDWYVNAATEAMLAEAVRDMAGLMRAQDEPPLTCVATNDASSPNGSPPHEDLVTSDEAQPIPSPTSTHTRAGKLLPFEEVKQDADDDAVKDTNKDAGDDVIEEAVKDANEDAYSDEFELNEDDLDMEDEIEVEACNTSPGDAASHQEETKVPEPAEEMQVEQSEVGVEEEEDPNAIQMDQEYIDAYIEQVLTESPYLEGGRWDPANGEPLAVELFLQVERARPQVSDLQHIYNKLLFDAIGEALTKVLGASTDNAPSWLQRRVKVCILSFHLVGQKGSSRVLLM